MLALILRSRSKKIATTTTRSSPSVTTQEECTDDTTYLLKCYDECKTWPGPGGHGRPVEYTWADIGFDSPSDGQGSVCGHSEVPCYCATACPETFGGDQGLIAGPCDADEPLKKTPGSGDADSRAP